MWEVTDTRLVGVAIARWFVTNKGQIAYSMGPDRMDGIGHPGVLPIACDCSSTNTIIANWAGWKDPNNNGYNGIGDTQTLPNGATGETNVWQCIPGDFVIYGLNGPLEHQHTAFIVQNIGDGNPLTMSHGWSGEPGLVNVLSGDPTGGAWGPPRYFRYDTTAIGPVWYPPGFPIPISPPVPGSPASKVPMRFRPKTTIPVLSFGMQQPKNWIVYLRLCLNAAGVGGFDNVQLGGYGVLTRNSVVRWQRKYPTISDTGICDLETWRTLGVV